MATQQPTIGQTSRRAYGNQAHGQQVSPTEVGKFLAGIDYPQSKSDIVAYAYAHGCGSDVIRSLEGLPERVYENLTELQADLGKVSHDPARG